MLAGPMVERGDRRDPIAGDASGGIEQHHRVEPTRHRKHERAGRVGGGGGNVTLDFPDRARHLGSRRHG
jgi:hypothetical protein